MTTGFGYESVSLFPRGEELTPSDSTTYSPALHAVVITATGDVTIVLEDDEEITFTGAIVGSTLPYSGIKKVKSSTTAGVASGRR